MRPLSREGSLSCRTCFDTGPRFTHSHPKECVVKSTFTTRNSLVEIHNFAKEINVLELIICIDTGKTAQCYKNMTCFQNLNDELEYV